MNKTKYEIIIRPKSNIKSRQWWLKKLLKLEKGFLKLLPKNKVSLYKNNSVTLLITNNKEIQYLNKKYRKINKPTDVLSFQLNKKAQINKKYLGDIVISIETARKHANAKMVSIENELSMLLIHAYLHLLGYDHMTRKDAKAMLAIQEKILSTIIK